MRVKTGNYYWVVEDGVAVDFGRLIVNTKKVGCQIESPFAGFKFVDKKSLEEFKGKKEDFPKEIDPVPYPKWRDVQIAYRKEEFPDEIFEEEVEDHDCGTCHGDGVVECGECGSESVCEDCDGEGYFEVNIDEFSLENYYIQVKSDRLRWIDFCYRKDRNRKVI